MLSTLERPAVSVFPPLLVFHPSIRVTEVPLKSPRFFRVHFVPTLTGRKRSTRILIPVSKPGRSEVRKTTRQAFDRVRPRQAPAVVYSKINISVYCQTFPQRHRFLNTKGCRTHSWNGCTVHVLNMLWFNPTNGKIKTWAIGQKIVSLTQTLLFVLATSDTLVPSSCFQAYVLNEKAFVPWFTVEIENWA